MGDGVQQRALGLADESRRGRIGEDRREGEGALETVSSLRGEHGHLCVVMRGREMNTST